MIAIIDYDAGNLASVKRAVAHIGFDCRVTNDLGRILGICLGTQIVLSHSRENDTACLGLLKGEVDAFDRHARLPDGGQLKIPHMGWNHIQRLKPHPLLADIGPEDEFYFVHSFYPSPEDPDHLLATTTYGVTFASVIGCRNLVATQFHLEKSGRPGLTMLKNFCTWSPS